MQRAIWFVFCILGLALAAGRVEAVSRPGGGVSAPAFVAAAPGQGTPTATMVPAGSPTPLPGSPSATPAPASSTPTPTAPPCALAATWNVAPSRNPNPSLNYLTGVVALARNDVWAVGSSGDTLTEHWDGSQWSVVPSPNQGLDYNYLSGVAAVSPSDIWAVGSYYNGGPYNTLTMHWNGQGWSIVPSPNPGGGFNDLFGVAAVSSNDVWAVGSNGDTLIEHWDGTSWSIVPSPNPGGSRNYLSEVAARAADDVWAVGYYSDSLSHSRTLIEHWDGTGWSVVPSPNVTTGYNEFFGVTARAANDAWAVGVSYAGGPSTAHTLIAHWDGSSWTLVPSPDQGTTDNILYSVAAVSATDVWAAGISSDSDFASRRTLIEHWDGSQWSIVPGPNPGSSTNHLSALAVAAPDDVWAVGFATSGSNQQTLTEHYTNQFADVAPNDPFYAYIRCLACRGIINGYTTSPPCATGTPCFLPGGSINRGQIAKMISNAAGWTDVIPSTQQTFTDVPYGSPFWLYIERAALHGVISGYGSSPPCSTGVPCFLPNNSVTRGQTAKIVANAAGWTDVIPSTQQTFTDVPYGNPFWLYVERVALHGAISGYSSSPPCTTGVPCFLPANNVTRGQSAKIVAQTFFPNCQILQR